MAEVERKRSSSKLARSETVTVRLDPKLRYLAELAARRQRRTVSSYIEWAIEQNLKHVALGLEEDRSLADEAEALWDVDDADRFARLALRHPDLLTHEEQVLWKLIKENGHLWRGNFRNIDKEWRWEVREESLLFDRLRKAWQVFTEVAETGEGRGKLPTWNRIEPSSAKTPAAKVSGFDDPDDDIPF